MPKLVHQSCSFYVGLEITKLILLVFMCLEIKQRQWKLSPERFHFLDLYLCCQKKVISRHIINHNKMPQNKYKALAPVPPTKSLKLIGRVTRHRDLGDQSRADPEL